MAFAAAMVLGPVLSNAFGFSALFWVTACLAITGMGVLLWLVPDPENSRFHRDTSALPSQFRRVFVDAGLLRLDAGIALLHMVMTASFVVLPLRLRDSAGLAGPEHWKVYLLVMLGALVLMTPFVMLADRRGRSREIFVGSIAVLALAQGGLWALPATLTYLVAIMVLYMTAFTVLEAALPSLVSRLAPAELKGTALGAYSTCQYLGVFAGGALGGWLHGSFGADSVFLMCAVMNLVWLGLALSMRYPPPMSTQLLRVGVVNAAAAQDLTSALRAVTGVRDAVVVPEEGIAYLKVDRHALDRDALMAYSVAAK
jgi:predicted MFS family arabinose efflux permease